MNLILTLLLGYIQVMQAQSMFPVEDMEKEGAIQGLHQALDSRFSTSGGTVTDVVVVGSSLTVGDRFYVNGIAQFQSISTFNATVVFNSSIQVNAGFFGEINQTTFTLINTNISISGTAMGPCLAGTTITLVTDATRVAVSFSGGINANASTTPSVIGFLVDGAFPTGTSSSIGLAFGIDYEGVIVSPKDSVSFQYLTRTALSAGSHSFCITGHGGTGSSAILDCTSAACNFEVREYH